MKKHRKLVALLVALTFLFSVVAPVMAAEPSAAEKAADKLNVLGIIEGYPDGTFGLDRNITRAEFAKVAVIAAGLKDAAEQLVNFPSQFSDVATGEWYTGWINMAASQGFVKGDPAGTYRPNDEITYAEVVTVLVRLLGYNDNLTGPWPTNYLAKAVELDITKDVALNANAPAVRGDVFIMTNNTLDCYTVKWSTEHQDFENLKAKLIVKSFKGSMFEGLVTDISWDSKGDIYLDVLYKDGGTLKGESLKVVENVIVSGADDPYGLVGWQVEFIKNQKSTGADRNAIVYLGAKDTNSVTKNEAKYDSRAKEIEIDKKKYDVASGFGVTYFPVDGSFDATKDATLSGDLVEVIINEDGDAQWAFVYQFKAPDIIEEIEDGKVYGHLKTRFEQKAKDVQVFIKDGVIADFDALAEGDLIYVFDGKDAKNADLLVFAVSEVFEGNLEEAHASWQTMTIDGTKYDVDYVNGDYIVSTDGGDTFNGSLNDDMFNDSIKYMLSPAGRIAVVISGATTQNLVGVVEATDTGVRGAEVRILKPDGTKAIYYVDSDYAKDPKGDYFNHVNGRSDVLVEYSLNKDGKIDKVKVAEKATFQDYDGSRAKLTIGTATDWYRVNADAGFFGYDSKNNLVATDWDTFKRVSKPDAGQPQPSIMVLMPKGAVKAMYINGQIVDVNKIGVIADSGRDGGKGFFYDIFIKGEKVRYNLASALQGNAKAEGYKKGDVVKFSLSGGKISAINDILVGDAAWVATGKVEERGADYVKVGGKYYYMDKDTMIVDVTESTKKIVRNVGVREDVKIYSLDSKGIVDLIVIYDGSADPLAPPSTDGVVGYVSATGDRIEIDGRRINLVDDARTTFASFRDQLVGAKVGLFTNAAGEGYAIKAVELEAKTTYTNGLINNLAAYSNIVIAGQGSTKTEVQGNVTIARDNVTITGVKINGSLTVDGANFKSRSNHISGDVVINGANASFNTEIGGTVTVKGTGASFSNVKVGGNFYVAVSAGTVTVSGSTTINGAINVEAGATIDASGATDSKVKTAASNAQDAADSVAVNNAKAKLEEKLKGDKVKVEKGANVVALANQVLAEEKITGVTVTAADVDGKLKDHVITANAGDTFGVDFKLVKGKAETTVTISFNVVAGKATKVSVSDFVYDPATAGIPFNVTFKLEAQDANGQRDKSFAGVKAVKVNGNTFATANFNEGVSTVVYGSVVLTKAGKNTLTIEVEGLGVTTQEVTVKPAELKTIRIIGAVNDLQIPKSGETETRRDITQDLTVKGEDQYGNNVDITVTWSVDPAYDNVSIEGTVLKIKAGAAPGTVTLKATSGGISATTKVVIK